MLHICLLRDIILPYHISNSCQGMRISNTNAMRTNTTQRLIWKAKTIKHHFLQCGKKKAGLKYGEAIIVEVQPRKEKAELSNFLFLPIILIYLIYIASSTFDIREAGSHIKYRYIESNFIYRTLKLYTVNGYFEIYWFCYVLHTSIKLITSSLHSIQLPTKC